MYVCFLRIGSLIPHVCFLSSAPAGFPQFLCFRDKRKQETTPQDRQKQMFTSHLVVHSDVTNSGFLIDAVVVCLLSLDDDFSGRHRHRRHQRGQFLHLCTYKAKTLLKSWMNPNCPICTCPLHGSAPPERVNRKRPCFVIEIECDQRKKRKEALTYAEMEPNRVRFWDLPPHVKSPELSLQAGNVFRVHLMLSWNSEDRQPREEGGKKTNKQTPRTLPELKLHQFNRRGITYNSRTVGH